MTDLLLHIVLYTVIASVGGFAGLLLAFSHQD